MRKENQNAHSIQNSKFHQSLKLDFSGQERFVQLPLCFFWDFPTLTEGARRCYVTLIKYALMSIENGNVTKDEIPIIWPSIETLARDMSFKGHKPITSRTIKNYLADLREVGLLALHEKRRPHDSDRWLLYTPHDAMKSGKITPLVDIDQKTKRKKFAYYKGKIISPTKGKIISPTKGKIISPKPRVVPKERVKEERRLAPAPGTGEPSAKNTGYDTRHTREDTLSDTGKYTACENFHNQPVDVAAMMSGGNKESPAPARASTGEASKEGKQNCNTMLKYFGERVNAGLGEKAPLFGGKERSLMKRLIDHYGYEIIQSAVDYLVNNWAVFKKKFPDYEFGAYPNVNILWAFRDTIIPLASSKEPKKEAAKRGGSIWG